MRQYCLLTRLCLRPLVYWLGHTLSDNGFRGSAHLTELLYGLLPDCCLGVAV